MVKKRSSAWIKNNLREIKHTLPRFFAIMAIVALGVGFFSGLNVTRPSMLAACEEYFDTYSFYDLRLISTLGLTDDDVDYISSLDGVSAAEGSVSADFVALDSDGTKMVLKAISVPEKVNGVRLVDGRMPESPDECLADANRFSSDDIGKVIKVSDESGSSADSLVSDKFTITGLCRSSLYINFERGTTNISDGALDGFIYIPAQGFDADYYTDIYLTLENGFEIFSDDYDDFIAAEKTRFEEAVEYRGELRYNEIVEEARASLAEGTAEYEEEYGKYLSSRAEAEAELADALSALEDAKAQIEENEKSLSDAAGMLESAQEEYESGLAEYESQYSQYLSEKQEALEQLDSNAAQLDEGIAGYESAISEIEESGVIGRYDALVSEASELETALAGTDASSEEYETIYRQLQTCLAMISEIEKTGVISEYQSAVGALAQLKENRAALETLAKETQDKFDEAEREFAAARSELESAAAQIEDNRAQLADGTEQLEEAKKKYESGMEEYESSKQEAEDGFAEAEAEFADAKRELDDAQADIDAIEKATCYVLGRDINIGYYSFENDTMIVDGIAKVFPIFFFLVAALVCMNTMTRMVEDQRTLIGTFKALGYSNAKIIFKYVSYAGSSALIGAAAGYIAGPWLFPQTIWKSYNIMYNITELPYILDPVIGVISVVVSLLCSAGATYLSCRSELREMPAELIRPRAPKAGKRVLLERVGIIWKRLGFLQKVTVRNIFRYKKRFIMMLMGIGGCTALILTGFGIRDSICDITDDQFGKIMRYDITISVDSGMTPEERARFVSQNSDLLSECVFVCEDTLEVTSESSSVIKTANVIVPEGDGLENVMNLEHDGERVGIPDTGSVLIDEALAEKLGVDIGDRITVRLDDTSSVELAVGGVFRNYVFSYMIMNHETYTGFVGRDAEYSTGYGICAGDDMRNIAETLMSDRGALSASLISDTRVQLDNMLENMNYVVWLVIFSAGALAFIVSFNLSNINVTERQREIATIKVLGFYPSESSAYVFRENLLLTAIGACVGLVMGVFLHMYVMSQIKVDAVSFDVNIKPLSFLFAVILTFVFSFLVDMVMRRKIASINMAESLKSIE